MSTYPAMTKPYRCRTFSSSCSKLPVCSLRENEKDGHPARVGTERNQRMELFLHVRVLFGMIVGLSVTHLLRGIANIVQHPKLYKIYWVHLLWVFFLFLYLIHFWWWEFNLGKLPDWTFPLYFFIAFYAVLLYLLC